MHNQARPSIFKILIVVSSFMLVLPCSNLLSEALLTPASIGQLENLLVFLFSLANIYINNECLASTKDSAKNKFYSPIGIDYFIIMCRILFKEYQNIAGYIPL